MDAFSVFVFPVLAGIVIGIMSGLLGIGGGTMMVPVFRLAFGMNPAMATATSLFAIVPTSVSGAYTHIRRKTCIPALGIAAGLGGAVTSPVGVWLAHVSPEWLIMVAAALIIGYSAVNMLRKAFKLRASKRGGDLGADASRSAAKADGADAVGSDGFERLTRKQLTIGAAIGAAAGLASGYVGVGGGFIMVPLMLSLVGIDMRWASGTSLVAVMILAVPGVIEQTLLGNVNYMAGISVAAGSIPGACIGARLVRMVPEVALRFVFGGFLIVAAMVLALNEFAILG